MSDRQACAYQAARIMPFNAAVLLCLAGVLDLAAFQRLAAGELGAELSRVEAER